MISSLGLAALIERTSRMVHSINYAADLHPAQWMALRFFSEAPPSSRTTAELARFQAMSLGPVARTVRTLVERGLVIRVANPVSRRADLIFLTDCAKEILKNDPRSQITDIIARMPTPQQITLANGIGTIMDHLLSEEQLF